MKRKLLEMRVDVAERIAGRNVTRINEMTWSIDGEVLGLNGAIATLEEKS
jgi:hypothetical protein